MKLIRFGEPRQEKPGIFLDGQRKDLSNFVKDYDWQFFNEGGIEKLRDIVTQNANSLANVPDNVRWGAPIARPNKVVCIGLNYADHAEEAGMTIPKEPVIFMKASYTVVGPYDTVYIPRKSKKTDWEVELGVVIGKDVTYIDKKDDAHNYIAGYCVSHDVSEREFQIEREGQWTKGKSCPTFNPIGPFLTTPEEIDNVNNLNLSLDLNGKRMQTGNTKTMVFDVNYIVHYLSQFMTLEAGDFITTGTPPGVGFGMKPEVYLKEGDVVELEIDNLGKQKQTIKQA